MLILAAFVFWSGPAAAQDGPVRLPPVSFTTTPASSTGARVVFTSQPAPARPRGNWSGRHPVLLGTMIGAGSLGAWEAIACGGHSCHVGTAALVGAGAGAYGGVIASAIQRARRHEPVGRGRKIALVGGAVGGAVAVFVACFAAGGCGGAS